MKQYKPFKPVTDNAKYEVQRPVIEGNPDYTKAKFKLVKKKKKRD